MNISYRLLGVLMSLLTLAACNRRATNQVSPEAQQDVKPVEELQVGELDRIHSSGSLYIASQPSESDLEELKGRRVVTVINLRPASETPKTDEAKQVDELGMAYINIPLSAPSEADKTFSNHHEQNERDGRDNK